MVPFDCDLPIMNYSISLVAITPMLSIIMPTPMSAATLYRYRNREKATGQRNCYYNKKCKANQHRFFHFHSPFCSIYWARGRQGPSCGHAVFTDSRL